MDNKNNNYERNNLSDPDDNTRSHMVTTEPETNLARETLHVPPTPTLQPTDTAYFVQQNPYLVNLNNSAQLNFLRNQNQYNPQMFQVSNSPRTSFRPAQIMDSYSHPGMYSNVQQQNQNMSNMNQPTNYISQNNLFGVRSPHPVNLNDGSYFTNIGNNSTNNPNSNQTHGSVPEQQNMATGNADSVDPENNVINSSQNNQAGRPSASPSVHYSQPMPSNYMISQVNMGDNAMMRPIMGRPNNPVQMNQMPLNQLNMNQMGMNPMGMNPVCVSPMPAAAPAQNNQMMNHQLPVTPITVATPPVVESNLNQTINYAHQDNIDANNHQSSSRMSGQMNAPHLQANAQPVSIQNAMPQLSQTNISQDPNNLQNRLAQIGAQMQQLQMTLATMSNSNNPQNANAFQFLNARLNQMKTVYIQLSIQQQQLQQQQIQRTMMMPGIQPQGFMPQYVNNPQAISMIQQQMLQNQYQNMQMGSMAPTRGNMVPTRFPMRMNAPIQPSMMLPPGLARFQGIRPFVQNNSNFMMSGGNIRGQMQPDSSRGGRRGMKQSRRRRLSSESEEEEEITTSEADTISQISHSDIQVDFMEPRRSTRNRVTRSYIQDIPDDSDVEEKSKKDNDSQLGNQQDLIPFQPNENIEGKIMLIERILADRFRPLEEGEDLSSASDGIVEEYYVKFKFYSYLHCEWCSESELKKRDRNAVSKIRRYKAKKKESPFLYMDEDPFNPDYVEIDRILDIKVTTDASNPDQKVNCYLVKWCALPYDESTWEFEEVVDELSIQQFHQRNTLPPPEALSYKPKPSVYSWQKIQKSPVYKNDNVLRDYQLEGINWLMYEYHCGTNCILADEMGLGKTIQSIAFLVEVKRAGIRGPFLIIAPLSTIGNWYREFLSWSDFNVVVFHGAASSRHIIHRYELNFRDENGEVIPDVCKFEVLITTYEMILSENKFLSSVRWRIAIVDEAHRLKNRRCKLLGNLSNIYTEHRVLLTGTPLQNTLDELLSLLNFLDPARAEALETMISQEAGGRLETNTQVQQIQSVLKPVILRRLKEDVEKNIAPKEETIIEVEMTSIQKKVYRGILERNLSFLTKGTTSTNLPNLMNIMMELRKCCNHPFLNNGVEEKILVEFASAHPTLDRQTMYRKALIESSGKMVLVDKLLPKLRDSGHKMLIFSQMVRVLDIIEEYLLSNGFAFERIDGGVRGNLRQAAIDRFSKPDSDRSVFLLCTKAGGLGINLTAADTVIIFDSDWNPQNDIQAQARCHRIGQNKAVKVYRLICRKTYEREMFDRASLKLGLDKAVLQDINYTNNDGKPPLPGARAQLSKKDVEELLRRGAYAAVMDEDTEASAQFCSEDIDQILERRATVIRIAGEIKGSTFAKASFNAEISGDQVDIDDPDFWQKWAKTAKVSSATDTKIDFVDDKPRIRKQVRSVQEIPGEDYELVNETSGRRSMPVSQRTSWFKKECLKVEKYLLIYGWGRWVDIFNDCDFKSNMNQHDVQQISKTILVIAWHVCKVNDNSFTDFVEKAIRLTTLKNRAEQDSDDFNYRPYGSKRTRSKKRETRKKNEKSKLCLYQTSSDWKNQDIDTLVFDLNYKKHLIHCASKILIRLRLLFHIEYYILRDCKDDVLAGVNIDDINVPLVAASRNSLTFPDWWDHICDRSLIVGTFKHGYEKYQFMVTDTQLCFSRHINVDSTVPASTDVLSRKRSSRKRRAANIPASSDEIVDLDSPSATHADTVWNSAENSNIEIPKLNDMPNNADLNTYTKRLVTLFWKNRSKSQLKQKVATDIKTTKWTRREETDFYKALTVYGVQYTPDGIIIWDGFRKHGKFDKKDDISMSLYLDALVRKCLSILNPEAQAISTTNTEAVNVSEGFLNYEKSEKVLKFMELFELIRKALRVPDVATKLKSVSNCTEFPDWWTSEHDLDLLKASALYGIDQADKRIFHDPSLSFNSVIKSVYDNLINSKEIIHGVTDVPNINSISIDLIKTIIAWPKFKVILNRLYALSMYATTSTWHPVFEIVIENLIEKSRQLMQISCQSENVDQPNTIIDNKDPSHSDLPPLDKPKPTGQPISITRQALG